LWDNELSLTNGSYFQEVAYHKKLVDAVVQNDIMVDKLILRDVQLTAANDDNYFVFEDVVLQAIRKSFSKVFAKKLMAFVE
jgi:hypothetical protein